jgi:branched-chain amino acid transport system substrate-binding protein
MVRMASVVAALLCALPASAQLKIAYIDPMSGPFANVGELGLRHFQGAIEKTNAAGGVLGGQKLEVIAFDNKGTPQDTNIVFKQVLDQGIRIVTLGNGSGSAAALLDAVNKHNSRNPGQEVIFLNYAAVDPDLTNVKCSYWHFRFDANTHQKMEAMTSYLAKQKDIKKVYIIGQDYQHGHQVAKYAKEMLAQKRPDVQVVGDDLHPMGKVKDFSPYVAKIKASGADAVISGNWGNDLSLLVKAAKDADLRTKFYTYYAGGIGTPTAIGAAGADRVVQVSEYHLNLSPNQGLQYAMDFKKKYKTDYYYERINVEIAMLAQAIDRAKSLDPKKVAAALEDMRFQSDAGEVWMRKADHQLVMPLYLSIFAKVDGKDVKYDVEETGYGFRTLATIPAKDLDVPNTCKMERP